MHYRDVHSPGYPLSTETARESEWRAPVLKTFLWIGALLGTTWLCSGLFLFAGATTSPEFIAILPGFAAVWVAALCRRWSEKARTLLLLFFCLDVAAVVAELAGLRPISVVMAFLFVLFATLYFGRKAGLAAAGIVVVTYSVLAAGWAYGVFPMSHVPEQPAYSQPRTWIAGILTVLLGVSAVGTIVGYVVAHSTQAIRWARESEEKFAKAFRASPDTIVISEAATGRIIDINEACERLFGIPRDKAVGRTSVEMGLWVDPQERALLAPLLAREGSVRGFQCQGRLGNGAIAFFEASIETIELQGKLSLVSIIHDVTERRRVETELRQSEAKLRAMFEGSMDAIGVAKAGIHVFANPAYLKLFGFENNEKIVGTPVISSIAPSHRQQVAENVQQRVSGGSAPKFYESRGIKVDGTEFDAEFSVSTFELDGEFYSIAHIRDISERRMAAEAKVRLEEQLRRSQKLEAVGTLASGIAHDFNNILTGILAYSSLARDATPGDTELGEYLDEIRKAGNRASELVRQILTFSRKGRGDEAMGPVRLEQVVAETFKLLRASSPSTIEFSTRVAQDLPSVLGNSTQLHQVVMNLGTNAVHAMHDGPGRLTVILDTQVVDLAQAGSLQELQPGPHLRLEIADTGSGMDAATQERVFEPFFTTKAPGEGTGLGLAVVYGIVRSHHGAIRLTSEVNRGTTFEIFLPAAPMRPAARVERPEILRGNGERILFVDDERTIARVGEIMLRRLGYAVDGERKVQQALERLQGNPYAFDLVISDQTMPGMTGIEFATQIHSLRADLPVIIMSGHCGAIAPERVKAAGVCELLSKPYTMEILAAIVGRHLRHNPAGLPS